MSNIALKEAQGSALAIVDTHDLAALFGSPGSIDDVVQRIESEVRSYAPDTSTSKGRKAIASLAAKVARSKTALDAAGKALNDDRRAAINAVDAERRKLRDRLDALKVEARAPLTEWEAAEEARIEKHTSGIARLRDLGNASDDATSAELAEAIATVESIVIDGSWDEFENEAGGAKDFALDRLRRSLSAAQTREAEQAELARLRAAQEERDRKEAEERAEADRLAKLADRASAAREYIAEVRSGRIGGEPQPFGILIYELDRKLPPLIDELEGHSDGIHRLRLEALRELEAAMKEQAAKDEALEAQRKADAERLAAEEAKQREAAAAQAERDRIEAERLAAVRAEAQRKKDAEHVEGIRGDIASSLSGILSADQASAVADALMASKVPHIKVMI